MDIAACMFVTMLLGAVQEQVPQDDPPKPNLEVPGVKPDAPLPLYPAGDGLTIRALALRPTFELTTREFDVGIFSRKMNFGEISDFDRTALGWDATLDAGNWKFALTLLHQEAESRLDQDMIFEQHKFSAGSRIKSVAFFGSLDAFYKFGVAGGPAETYQASFLLGINVSKFYLMTRGGGAEASEGFSALWPLPVLGVETRVWLHERLSLNLTARGTRLRYENPFHLDGGGSQVMKYTYGRIDAGFEWNLHERFSVAAGYTGLNAHINAASAEDTDRADLKAGGVHAGLTVRF